jgi:hypothetical protein
LFNKNKEKRCFNHSNVDNNKEKKLNSEREKEREKGR